MYLFGEVLIINFVAATSEMMLNDEREDEFVKKVRDVIELHLTETNFTMQICFYKPFATAS